MNVYVRPGGGYYPHRSAFCLLTGLIVLEGYIHGREICLDRQDKVILRGEFNEKQED